MERGLNGFTRIKIREKKYLINVSLLRFGKHSVNSGLQFNRKSVILLKTIIIVTIDILPYKNIIDIFIVKHNRSFYDYS